MLSLSRGDFDDFTRLYTNSDVRRFLGGVVPTDEIPRRFSNLLDTSNDPIPWIVRCKADNAFMGLVSLSTHHNGTDTEVSYQLLPQYWQQGYGREVVQWLLDYAHHTLMLPRVIAETQLANVASRRLLEKLGLHLIDTVERFGVQQAIYTTDRASKV